MWRYFVQVLNPQINFNCEKMMTVYFIDCTIDSFSDDFFYGWCFFHSTRMIFLLPLFIIMCVLIKQFSCNYNYFNSEGSNHVNLVILVRLSSILISFTSECLLYQSDNLFIVFWIHFHHFHIFLMTCWFIAMQKYSFNQEHSYSRYYHNNPYLFCKFRKDPLFIFIEFYHN